ncbi:hypothetical protein ACFYXC_40470 [Streptomyces sp. NPDC002701]|uniref:hypothetical protein n=1 Tax=Streptomyces sp. NPDC002701 TaxID=3364661 RepID=UPI00369A58A6
MEAVRALHYVMNVHARALPGQLAGPVALGMNDITGPSLTQIAVGVEQEAAANGRLSLVCATHDDVERKDNLVQMMRQKHAAAVVLVGGAQLTRSYTRRMTEYTRALDAAGSRLVLVGPPPLPSGVPATVVEYDNRGGAFQATTHLLAAGHRRILLLGDHLINAAVQRREGFLDALRPWHAVRGRNGGPGSLHPHVGLPADARCVA